MSSQRISSKLFNFPKNVSEEQKLANDLFIESLQESLEKYEFAPSGGIDKICVALIYNKYIDKTNAEIYNDNLFFLYYNFPKTISKEQSIKNSVFRANLDLLLKSYKFFLHGGISKLIVILYYNKYIDEIQIEGLNDPVKKNEEGLAFFAPTIPKYRIDQVILNEDLLNEIRRTLLILEHRHMIYEEWGFNEIDPEPRAIINFFGPPGTGKTMTAHSIANELGCSILALNYADIESKFVGDAPKNLVRAFETATETKSLLFFDEADSFLGKRISNVSTSSDQAVNSLRSQMLILLFITGHFLTPRSRCERRREWASPH